MIQNLIKSEQDMDQVIHGVNRPIDIFFLSNYSLTYQIVIINLSSASPATTPRLSVFGKDDKGILKSNIISSPKSVTLQSPKSVSSQNINFGPGIEMLMNPKKIYHEIPIQMLHNNW